MFEQVLKLEPNTNFVLVGLEQKPRRSWVLTVREELALEQELNKCLLLFEQELEQEQELNKCLVLFEQELEQEQQLNKS
jgi:hypothetical protein